LFDWAPHTHNRGTIPDLRVEVDAPGQQRSSGILIGGW
jgi:hypothetical protein